MMLRAAVTVVLLAGLGVFVAGCASGLGRPAPPRVNDEQLAAAVEAYNAGISDPRATVVCAREANTRSRLPRLVCKTLARMGAERREIEQLLSERFEPAEGYGYTPPR